MAFMVAAGTKPGDSSVSSWQMSMKETLHTLHVCTQHTCTQHTCTQHTRPAGVCGYGVPFYSPGSSIVAFMVAAGTKPGDSSVSSWQVSTKELCTQQHTAIQAHMYTAHMRMYT